MSKELAFELSRASNALATGDLYEATLPGALRLAFESRAAELAASLAAPPADRVRAIVAGLGTMPTRAEADAALARFTFDQYLEICGDAPEWALAAAARAFLRNEAGSGFRPSAGELRALAFEMSEREHAEFDKLRRVLRARIAPPQKPVSAERRAEIAAMARKAMAEMNARATLAEAERIAERRGQAAGAAKQAGDER